MIRIVIGICAAAHPFTTAGQPVLSARAIVTASAEAIGGVDRLRAIRSLRVEETGGEYLVSTVTRRDAPPRFIAQTLATIRVPQDSALRRTLVQALPMRAGSFTSTTVANRGAVAVVRGSVLVPGSAFDLATANEDLALAPERVLLAALDARDLRLERDTTIGDVRHHVVSLGFAGASVRVYVDAESSFPTHVELVRAYPTNAFWAMWGDLRFATTWSAWALDTSGVWYPRQRSITLNGQPFREYVVTSLAIDAGDAASAAAAGPAVRDSVAISDSVRTAFATRLAAERAAEDRPGTPRLTPVELGGGVVLYQGGYQTAAVRQHDGVVIIEGPESNAKSAAVLADVAARWPGARVKAVVSTSPMWMHVGGLREYAARSIPIYALDVNVPVVRALLSAPHRQVPDSLARGHGTPILRAVRARTILGESAERLELRPARGQHSSSMMLVWMPAGRLLYASDVVVPDAFEPVFTTAYQAELARIVRREGLDVARVFGEHLPVASWAPRGR
jgi:hypothetical protein